MSPDLPNEDTAYTTTPSTEPDISNDYAVTEATGLEDWSTTTPPIEEQVSVEASIEPSSDGSPDIHENVLETEGDPEQENAEKSDFSETIEHYVESSKDFVSILF